MLENTMKCLFFGFLLVLTTEGCSLMSAPPDATAERQRSKLATNRALDQASLTHEDLLLCVTDYAIAHAQSTVHASEIAETAIGMCADQEKLFRIATRDAFRAAALQDSIERGTPLPSYTIVDLRAEKNANEQMATARIFALDSVVKLRTPEN